MGDMAQILNVTAEYLNISGKLTKELLNFLKNAFLIMYSSHLNNSSGKVGKRKMDKISRDKDGNLRPQDCVKVAPENEKAFLKMCTKHGIPVAKVKSINEDCNRFIYPMEYSNLMESVMDIVRKTAIKNNNNKNESLDETTKRVNSENQLIPLKEGFKDLGCDMPHEEFKKKFIEKFATPEEKEYLENLEKKRVLPEVVEINREINIAISKNESKSRKNRFERDGMVTVAFKKDQIIGTVEKDNKKYAKISFENDPSQAFLVAEDNIVKYGDKLYGGFKKDGNITVYDLKNNSEKTVKFNEFIKNADKQYSSEHKKSNTKSKGATSKSLPGSSGAKPKIKGGK